MLCLLLLFRRRNKDNADVRWASRFNGRASDHEHKQENRSLTGDPRPDFLCIGAHKGGTTWLYQQLDSHPDFWMPPIKELHYFDQLSRVQRTAPPRCRDERDLRFLENIKSLSDVPDIDQVNRNVLRRGMLLRSYPSAVVARWKRYVHPERFRIYFFDDLQRNPAELRRSILHFLGADPDKPSRRVAADCNSWAGLEKLPLTDKVRSHLAQFFKKELKTCAARLGGPARDWPARYGF